MAVNVSEVQLRQPNFVATVLASLGPDTRQTGIDLEITETMIAAKHRRNVQKLLRLREAGLQIFMDDFGTGYSGLSQIAQLPLDALKIDRAFVAGMTISAEHMAIVSTIINLATRPAHLSWSPKESKPKSKPARLLALGCDEAQGYLFSRPMPGRGHRETPVPAPLTEPRLTASLSAVMLGSIWCIATSSEPRNYPGDSRADDEAGALCGGGECRADSLACRARYPRLGGLRPRHR